MGTQQDVEIGVPASVEGPKLQRGKSAHEFAMLCQKALMFGIKPVPKDGYSRSGQVYT